MIDHVLARPGSRCWQSGQWEAVDLAGNVYPGEITVAKHERMPPTPAPGLFWRLVDASQSRAEAGSADDDEPDAPP